MTSQTTSEGRHPTAARATIIAAGIVLALLAPLHPARTDDTRRHDPSQSDLPESLAFEHAQTIALGPSTPFEPVDLAVLPGGNVYVADGASQRIVVFAPGGERVDSFTRRPGPVAGTNQEFDGFAPLALSYRASKQELMVAYAGIDADSPRYGEGPVSIKRMLWGSYSPAFDEITLGIGSGQSEHTDLATRPSNGEVAYSLSGSRIIGFPDIRQVIDIATTPEVRALRIAAIGADELAAANPDSGAIEVYTRTLELLAELSLPGMSMIAPARGIDGRLWALAWPSAAGSEPSARLLEYDGDLNRVGNIEVALGHLPDADSDWPWALDISSDGYLAFSSAGERFEIHRLDPEGRRLPTLIGGPVRDRYVLEHRETERSEHPPLSIAMTEQGELLLLDRASDALSVIERDGRLRALGTLPDAVQISAIDGDVVALDAQRRISRHDLADLERPRWRQPCACEAQSRTASEAGRLFVSLPNEGRVLAVDAGSGARAAGTVTGTRALWPQDIALDGAGRLLSANLSDGSIEHWNAEGSRIARAWPGGADRGPLRIGNAVELPQGPTLPVLTADGMVETYLLAEGLRTGRWDPRDAEGRRIEASDIVMSAEGDLYLVEPAGRAVHRFRMRRGPTVETATPTVAPTEAPTPSARSCRIEGDKRAWPARIVLGQSSAITLTLRADCPDRAEYVGADLVLLLDRSRSMSEGKLEAARDGARRLIGLFDRPEHRIGLVSFNDADRIDLPLGRDLPALLRAIDEPRPEGYTDLGRALQTAHAHLAAEARPEALPVLVLLSDGWSNRNPDEIDMDALAAGMHAGGLQVFAIAYGQTVNEDALRRLINAPEHLRRADQDDAVFDTYRTVQSLMWANQAVDLRIEDEMGPDIDYPSGSARPAALENGPVLHWSRPVLPSSGITLGYRVRPRSTGLLPANRYARAHYRDADGSQRSFDFPLPRIEVVAPSPTPTPSATQTATPYPPALLPIVQRSACRYLRPRVDTALVIDASGSMLETDVGGSSKLDHAIEAARRYIAGSDLAGGDRIALVRFHADARLIHGLASDPRSLDRALEGISAAAQTRIDLGIEAARIELLRDRPDARKAMIVLTDGRANPVAPETVLAQAARAKAEGIILFGIGLGADVDRDQLLGIATSPDHVFLLSEAGQLPGVYDRIVGDLSCPERLRWPVP